MYLDQYYFAQRENFIVCRELNSLQEKSIKKIFGVGSQVPQLLEYSENPIFSIYPKNDPYHWDWEGQGVKFFFFIFLKRTLDYLGKTTLELIHHIHGVRYRMY